MFGKDWFGNSKECLIFARSYDGLDKLKMALENIESNQLNY